MSESQHTIPTSNQYKVDASEIEDIEDVKAIIEALDIRMTERHPRFEKFEPYLKKVE